PSMARIGAIQALPIRTDGARRVAAPISRSAFDGSNLTRARSSSSLFNCIIHVHDEAITDDARQTKEKPKTRQNRDNAKQCDKWTDVSVCTQEPLLPRSGELEEEHERDRHERERNP